MKKENSENDRVNHQSLKFTLDGNHSRLEDMEIVSSSAMWCLGCVRLLQMRQRLITAR